jgi:hypothetical protein
MDDKKPNPRVIAEEAVGERRDSPIPDAAKGQAEMPTEEIIRQLATSVGSQANMAAKTAEAVGERVGEAVAERWSASRVSGNSCGQTAVHDCRRGLRPRLCRRVIDSPPPVTGKPPD